MRYRKRWVLSTIMLIGLIGSASFSIHMTDAQEVSPDAGGTMAWSPDGANLAVFARNGVFIYDRDFRLLRYRDRPSASGRWSADGTKLVVDRSVLSADTLDVVREYDKPFHTWLDSGSQVIDFGTTGREIRILDVTDGSLIKTIASPAQIEYAVPSPDGTHILVVVANGILIFDVGRGALVGEYTLPVRSIRHYTWNSDGTRIAYSADVDVPVGTPGSIPSPSASNLDSSSLYAVSIMDASTGEILLTSEPLPESILSVTWSRNAPRLAGMTYTGAVYIWDTDTLTLLTAFSIPGHVTLRMAYSPYGGVVAIGMNPTASAPSIPPNNQQPLEQAQNLFSLANDTIQLLVPEASLERLEAIQAACARKSDGAAISIIIPQAQSDLGRYIAQVEAAPAVQIPPGCAADLIAIAKAIQNQ